ncbi:kinesin-like protein Nod [Coccinella septempunctata]|uniref:kinesin-like protein Nod n=1 Tax=Coccinella septempunctata TaxID=41139 RepID=UPI001D063F17|nr:kinesin-like protein Nod [Coccinella septempunctata]
MNLDDHVNVSVRLKPPPRRRSFKSSLQVISSDPALLLATERQQTFHFDNIFEEDSSQEEIYGKIVKPLVGKVKDGYNCTIFAYGQTGTGKTYTMGTNSLEKNDGIIPRALDDFFSYDNGEVDVHVSFMEIYNERVYDLLKSNNETPLPLKGFRVEGLSKQKVFNIYEAKSFLKLGGKKRHTGETKQNMFSSRSHAIFSIEFTVDHGNKQTCAKLNLVDLAGSESVKKTGTQGNSFQEGININKGLLCIGQVMTALSSNLSYIPYRQSIITTILQDSLNRNNYISLIACVKCDIEDANESIQALEFAQRVKKMKNKPEVNEILMKFKLDNPLLERNGRSSSTPMKRAPATPFRINQFKKPKLLSTLNCHAEMSGVSINNSKSTVSMTSACNSEMGTNFSPILRKYMGALENTLMDKLENVIQNTLKRPTRRSARLSAIAGKENTPKYSWREIQPKVAKLVQKEVIQMTSKTLRATSSPIDHEDIDQAKKILVFDDQISMQTSEVSENELNEKKELQKLTPCISPINHNQTKDPFENDFIFKKPALPNKTNVEKEQFNSSETTKVAPRRSTRISIRSQRILNETRELNESNIKNNNRNSKRKKLPKFPENCGCEHTKISEPKKKGKSKNTESPKQMRTREVLDILNSGDKKDLQKLATIGPKTAERILLFRHIKGNFASVKELSDMPGWSKTYFNNFIDQNFLNI